MEETIHNLKREKNVYEQQVRLLKTTVQKLKRQVISYENSNVVNGQSQSVHGVVAELGKLERMAESIYSLRQDRGLQ